MEGQLLSREDPARGHARLVRRAPAVGGDQQHLLPDAQGRGAGALGAGHARGLSLRDQGVQAHHARRAAGGRRGGRLGGLSLQEPGGARRQARAGAVPAAALPEEGHGAAAGLPAAAARRPPRGLRVPPRQLVRRRGLRAAARPPARRCACRSAKTARRRRWCETAPWGYVRLRLENYTRCRPGGVGRPAGGDAVAGGARVLHARADRARLRGGAAALAAQRQAS